MPKKSVMTKQYMSVYSGIRISKRCADRPQRPYRVVLGLADALMYSLRFIKINWKHRHRRADRAIYSMQISELRPASHFLPWSWCRRRRTPCCIEIRPPALPIPPLLIRAIKAGGRVRRHLRLSLEKWIFPLNTNAVIFRISESHHHSTFLRDTASYQIIGLSIFYFNR